MTNTASQANGERRGVTILVDTETHMMPTLAREKARADKDPNVRKQIEASLPLGKLVQPEEAAYFMAALIDGKGTGQTGQFFAIDGGWAEEERHE